MQNNSQPQGMKNIFFLFLLFSSPLLWRGAGGEAFCQKEKEKQPGFSTEPAEFIEELEKTMKETKRDDCKETADAFTKAWSGGQFGVDEQQNIIQVFNTMLGRKMTPHPYYLIFLQSVLSFPQSGLPDTYFDTWMNIIVKILETSKKGNNKTFQTFVEFSKPFFLNNYLYDSKAKSWGSSSRNFTFQYDSIPKLIFPALDLFAITKGDTIFINETKGVYYPLTDIWMGEGGKVDWIRAGLSPLEVYAQIRSYKLNLNESGYTMDSIQLTHKGLLYGALLGQLRDKLSVDNTEDKSNYPKFDSYARDLKIDHLADNVKYYGGLSLYGGRIVGRGDKDLKAVMQFFTQENKLALVAKSKQFTIKPKEIVLSKDAETTIYLGKDSIYHPGLDLSFKIPNRELLLIRGGQGISRSRFYNSYQQVEMEMDKITWKLDEPKMLFDNISGKGQQAAYFESGNFFEKGRLEKYQNILDYNPIHVIKKYAEDNRTREMYTDLLAKKMGDKYDMETIRRLLYKLVEEGFIYYDLDKELITAKDKIFNYVFANAEMIDYDAIRVKALTNDVTGTLNLTNYTLDLNGVKNLLLSDSQFVVIFPKDKFLQVKKNRDMDFSGSVFAGRMDFNGTGFNFLYNQFKLGLSKVDSFQINIPGKQLDEIGKPVLIPLKTLIEGLTGAIAIDAPDNKSGKRDIPRYPVFESLKESYAYYEKPYILGNVYPRKRFFFRLDPFVIDSLDTFDPAAMFFNGTLVSAGIFPDFKEKLRIQPDLSLGFITKTPPTGYALYGGKGTYNDTIKLSNNGLRGLGHFKYLASMTASQDIIFFPDSLNSNSDSLTVTKSTLNGIQYPLVHGKDFYTHWIPYHDSMFMQMKNDPFYFDEWKATLKGNFVLSPKGLAGDGTMEWEEAILKSNQFRFQSNTFVADTSSLEMKSLDPKSVAFRAPNVKSNVDFSKRIGYFKSNIEGLPVDFPYNQYKTTINEFTWDMDKKTIDFKGPPKIEDTYFTSTHPDQDSLNFHGSGALYSLETYILDVKGVPYIYVADAKITPDSGKVVIEPEAKMQQLLNAKIEANMETHYHLFKKASVNIYGAKNYKGSGSYDYINKTKKKQEIFFEKIYVYKDKKDDEPITEADAVIPESQNFQLNPRILFKNNVKLFAKRKYLTFDGYAKLEQKHPKINSQWFSFTNEINPDSLYITVTENTKNDKNERLFVGIHLSSTDLLSPMYTNFLGTKKASLDEDVFLASGLLDINEAKNEFRIGDEKKMKEDALRGNLFTFNDKTGQVHCEGKINLNCDIHQANIVCAGKIDNDLNKNIYNFNVLLGLKFKIAKEVVEKLAQEVAELSYDLPDLNYGLKPDFPKAMVELVDAKEEKMANAMVEEYYKSGVFKKPKDLDYTFTFVDFKIDYIAETHSFQSRGPVGLAYIGDKMLNKNVLVYLEFGTKRSGDYFNMYIQPGLPENWFYFEYKAGLMNISSSSKEFIKTINAIDSDKRASGDANKMFRYQGVESERSMKKFVEKMKAAEEQPEEGK